MTTYKDNDLREALRRKFADTPQMPTGISERLMKRMETTQKPPRRRYWPYITTVLSIAASILLLIVLLPRQKTIEQPTMATKEKAVPIDSAQPSLKYIVPTETTEQTIMAQTIPDKNNTNKAIVNEPRKPKADSASAAENLADCIARLEAEMDALDDSVREAHLEKLIAADARLQRMVDHIVGKQAEQALNGLQNDSAANYIHF
ncbi:MAG: hypothetical protein IKT00_09115 [Prevotella sp.]|nr:hypothetical protein [Prevotella sp.]